MSDSIEREQQEDSFKRDTAIPSYTGRIICDHVGSDKASVCGMQSGDF